MADGYSLWVETTGDPQLPPLFLMMGANASGVAWPDALVDRLAESHYVIRYDHRDTGRSTHAFDERPYPLTALAEDAVAILDALKLDRVHAVGMSLGGTLLQVLLADHPERLRSATLFGTAALGDEDAPGPSPRLLELWGEMGQSRTAEEERAWQLAHWQLLAGDVLPFDAADFDALDQRLEEHRGSAIGATAHAQADQSGLERDLGTITTPVLVIDALEDPVAPPPTAEGLATLIPTAERVPIEGMGHALPRTILEPLAAAISAHTARH